MNQTNLSVGKPYIDYTLDQLMQPGFLTKVYGSENIERFVREKIHGDKYNPSVEQNLLKLLGSELGSVEDYILTVKDNQVIVKDSEDWTDIDRVLINNVEQGRNQIKVDFLDKKWAMTTLLKLYGLINETSNEGGTITTGLEEKSTEDIMKLLETIEGDEDE